MTGMTREKTSLKLNRYCRGCWRSAARQVDNPDGSVHIDEIVVLHPASNEREIEFIGAGRG